ncbi:hypothetical protein [Nucisporomicrobium flavum]|jgi:hypothetical protein|uniref:hypothetical protein n=1 Tax=Nucisporomicrobium flavum TaxID=2785915 RepID=UPI0018F5FE4C|nr:hypothetical protein [Nucisporomicrobium flavum]
MDAETGLPFVDEQHTTVPAPAPVAWELLCARVPRFADAETYARLIGARPRGFSGGPLAEGSTLPGFEVTEAVPGRLLRLAGRHAFSRYELVLALSEEDGGTRLSARTYAEFPGVHGFAYRALVIGSGAHRFFVARLLRGVREAAR